MTDDKITTLPIAFKSPQPEEKMLKVVRGSGCDHRWTWKDGTMRCVTYVLSNEGETEVECGACGTRLDPMFVLRRLAHEETKWHDTRQRYNDEMKRLDERTRTKCDNCGKMTRISRR
ncbi:MAG TPA: hypothetical protein VK602_00755 [Phyllobacterium sp.]|nr:hypothetical protein [Phyllobacterium sp.]